MVSRGVSYGFTCKSPRNERQAITWSTAIQHPQAARGSNRSRETQRFGAEPSLLRWLKEWDIWLSHGNWWLVISIWFKLIECCSMFFHVFPGFSMFFHVFPGSFTHGFPLWDVNVRWGVIEQHRLYTTQGLCQHMDLDLQGKASRMFLNDIQMWSVIN